MKTKKRPTHTPGPWDYDVFDKVYILGPRMKSKSGDMSPVYIAEMTDEDSEGLCPPDIETVKANGRLVAAAPELLEVARRVVLDWEAGDDISDDTLEQTAVMARKLIRSVEGK